MVHYSVLEKIDANKMFLNWQFFFTGDRSFKIIETSSPIIANKSISRLRIVPALSLQRCSFD